MARLIERPPPPKPELLDLVASDPEGLEAGLTLLERNFRLPDRATVDLLLLDAHGLLCLVFVEATHRAGLPVEALDACESVHSGGDLLKRLFPGRAFAAEALPRLLLVAPSFAPALERVALWLAPVRPELLQFVLLAPETGPPALFFRPAGHPRIGARSDPLRELNDRARFLIAKLGSEVSARERNGRTEFLAHGELLCTLEPRTDCLDLACEDRTERVSDTHLLHGAMNRVLDRFFRLRREHGAPAAPGGPLSHADVLSEREVQEFLKSRS